MAFDEFYLLIDLLLHSQHSPEEHREWDYLCDSFMKNLQTRSSNVFPYRLFIDK